MLMAEIERTNTATAAAPRAWTLRAVRADARSGLDRGRLCQRPLAAVRRCRAGSMRFNGRRRWRIAIGQKCAIERPNSMPRYRAAPRRASARALGEVTPPPRRVITGYSQLLTPAVEPPATTARCGRRRQPRPPGNGGPLFRARQDIPRDAAKGAPSGIPPVISIVRHRMIRGSTRSRQATNSPKQINPAHGQAGGWRGFLSRWGGYQTSGSGTSASSGY